MGKSVLINETYYALRMARGTGGVAVMRRIKRFLSANAQQDDDPIHCGKFSKC